MSTAKRIEDLTEADLLAASVWQYTNSDELGETAVRPIKKLPVKNLTGRVAATRVKLANGSTAWALIGNVDVTNPRLTEHFLTLSILRDGRWFTMARYHDFDAAERGPDALAKFCGLGVNDVFPISYDISQASLGDPAALVGTIEKEPRERLTRAQIIALAVP
ncbi:MAG: hypothetical protein ACREIA_07495 [Opitutaceae bacterium]